MKFVFCLPGRDYSREFLLCWSNLLIQCLAKGHQIVLSQHYSSMVHFARAKCLGGDVTKGPNQKPFQGQIDYDVIMWIDSDVVFEPDDFFKLLESPHDVTSGIYMSEDGQHLSVVEKRDESYFKTYGTFEMLTLDNLKYAPRYLKVSYAGMGWMCIKKGAIEKLKYPWFQSELQNIQDELTDIQSEDVSFCRALERAGVDIYIDKTVRVGHQKRMIL